MTRNQNVTAIVLVLGVAAAIVISLQLRSNRASAVAPASGSSLAPVAKPLEPGQGSAPKPPKRVRRLADPTGGRHQLLNQIRSAQAKRTAGNAASSGSAAAPPTLPEGHIDKAYIQASVRELIPLLAECFEQGLAQNPKLGGSIIVDFTIEGEPGVGGVIGESTIDAAASTLTDATVRECVQETMFAIEIEPPAGGGVIKVRYPFDFRVDAD
ncbi:MAG: AgmX/PglI C-terminal domain-containing protein [Deltaproteobacteria bacterium]|nr:AgmX/PglI C-terminal domain-containing protein [Deltaproteobacteria bacterium]